jgi:hypothetical protein
MRTASPPIRPASDSTVTVVRIAVAVIVAYAVIALAGFFLALAIHWPWLAGPLQFEPLPLWPLLMALASGLLSGVGISVLHGVMSAWQRQPKGHR